MNWSCVEIVVIKKSDFFEVWIYVEIFIDSKYKTKNKKLYEDVCFLDCLYDYKVRWQLLIITWTQFNGFGNLGRWWASN